MPDLTSLTSPALSSVYHSSLCSTLRPSKSKSRLVGRQKPVQASSSSSSSSFHQPRKRGDWDLGPSFHLSKQQAVQMQMQALLENTTPYVDHGIEVLYRFANFDPFRRSAYFGRSLDLGQFERFRRIMNTPFFSVLLCHTQSQLLSELQVSEHVWVQRVWVKGFVKDAEDTFSFRMQQRLGGRYDGIWFTDSLTCDKCPKEVLLSV